MSPYGSWPWAHEKRGKSRWCCGGGRSQRLLLVLPLLPRRGCTSASFSDDQGPVASPSRKHADVKFKSFKTVAATLPTLLGDLTRSLFVAEMPPSSCSSSAELFVSFLCCSRANLISSAFWASRASRICSSEAARGPAWRPAPERMPSPTRRRPLGVGAGPVSSSGPKPPFRGDATDAWAECLGSNAPPSRVLTGGRSAPPHPGVNAGSSLNNDSSLDCTIGSRSACVALGRLAGSRCSRLMQSFCRPSEDEDGKGRGGPAKIRSANPLGCAWSYGGHKETSS
mmetsp:Transcript_96079/g.170157  ORF Transcript_96079/g.170157 Transcript_96079/m.170157 type:complete len:283 (-) Transcript_96079:162-1010(-)